MIIGEDLLPLRLLPLWLEPPPAPTTQAALIHTLSLQSSDSVSASLAPFFDVPLRILLLSITRR